MQLVVRNVGGGRPGEVDRAAHGNPGKLSFCFAELTDSPIGTLAEQQGLPPGVDAVTVFAGEGPRCVVDQLSRTPESLAASLAACLRTVHHPKLPLAFDAILVLGPEHLRVFADGGLGPRPHPRPSSHARLQLAGAEIVRGAGGIDEGVPESRSPTTRCRSSGPAACCSRPRVAGPGLFSAIIGGWANGATGSTPVTRRGRTVR